VENLFFQKNTLQDLLSSLNAVISTNESTQLITGHMVYNLAYTKILQMTTTIVWAFEIRDARKCRIASRWPLFSSSKKSLKGFKKHFKLCFFILKY
jgi:hypothetical protein